MTILQERNQDKLSQLAEIQASIEQLKQQIDNLSDKFVEETKFANAQANLTKQWQEVLTPIENLLTLACGVYQDINVLDDMREDLEQIVENVKINFEQNKEKPNKFLDDAKKIESEVIQPKLKESKTEIKAEIDVEEIVDLPPINNDIIALNDKQITFILKENDIGYKDIKKLAILCELEGVRSIKDFIEKGANHLTRKIIEDNIDLIKQRPKQISLLAD